MKRNLLRLTILLLVLAGSISSCEKEIDISNVENLYEQPLSVIQKCVQGKWERRYILGGFAGKTPIADSVFVEINGNKINGREFQWKKYTITMIDESLFSTYAIQYTEFDEPSFYFGNIENNILSIGYIGGIPNCCDCYTGEEWVRVK